MELVWEKILNSKRVQRAVGFTRWRPRVDGGPPRWRDLGELPDYDILVIHQFFTLLASCLSQVREDESSSVEEGCAGMGGQAGLQGNRGRFVGRAGRRKCRESDETHAIFRADGEHEG